MQEFIEMVLSDDSADVPQPLRAELLAVICNADGMSRLKDYFSAHPGSAITLRSACRSYAFRYIESEIARLSGLKNAGILSAQDEKMARTELQGLLDKIEDMCVRGIQSAIRSERSKGH